ncbi:MAG: two-component system, NarL family, sensor kinase, partial [Actinomycetota bacterium]|nr:two-component system, NarL family, sensor kinase [Actinomycetota bacterium]
MSVTKAVLTFALSGTIVLVLVGVVGVVVMQRVGQAEAIRQAKDITSVAARVVVQPGLTDGILNGDAASLNALDLLVGRDVLHDPIVRVKIWAPDGTIVYSDEPDLIGERFTLGADELYALRSDVVDADVSDLSEPENRFERGFGQLLEVYLPLHTKTGQPLLFEAYLLYDSVSTSARQLWRAFLPVLAIALIALALLQIPLASRLAGRVREGQRERERLLQRAIDASDLERRRIAGDLHDGPVQQLAGVSMSLAAAADRLEADDPEASAALRDAGERTRLGMRSLRSSLMGIYPPTLERAGISAALADLTAPLAGYGIAVDLDIDQALSLPPQVESLLFRAAQEAIRNVTAHAEATNVRVRLARQNDAATLEIVDDGRGFSPPQAEAARTEGHLGLRLLADLARDAGATVDIIS